MQSMQTIFVIMFQDEHDPGSKVPCNMPLTLAKESLRRKKTHVLKKQSHDDEHEGGKKLAPPCVPRGIVFHLASFKAILY